MRDFEKEWSWSWTIDFSRVLAPIIKWCERTERWLEDRKRKQIKTVTIERDGAEIVVNRKDPEKKMGFRS